MRLVNIAFSFFSIFRCTKDAQAPSLFSYTSTKRAHEAVGSPNVSWQPCPSSVERTRAFLPEGGGGGGLYIVCTPKKKSLVLHGDDKRYAINIRAFIS